MRARTLLLLILALVIAVGTAMLARTWLATQRREVASAPAAPPKPARSVLVARNDITRGQILKPNDLTWQVWPDGTIDKSYIVSGGPKKPESYAGWVAVNPIDGGEPVTESRIVSPGSRGFLAAVLSPGMRAISVPVTLTSGISGLIFPGDRVDLVMTLQLPQAPAINGAPTSNYQHKAAETVLRNIRVIAIDQVLQGKSGEAIPNARNATFEVTPQQTEVIALAGEIGRISLVLRSLVPEPQMSAGGEMKSTGSEMKVAGGATPVNPDSPMNESTSPLIDSDISPLLPKVTRGKDASPTNVVTILHGSGKKEEVRTSEPAP